mmetsp:Transcript_13901/g.36045  ORF Transcript_13901/g.36045 Transcript_13901/m.36045 type:complete len:247 (+) Transcript_13901:71-811(+)
MTQVNTRLGDEHWRRAFQVAEARHQRVEPRDPLKALDQCWPRRRITLTRGCGPSIGLPLPAVAHLDAPRLDDRDIRDHALRARVGDTRILRPTKHRRSRGLSGPTCDFVLDDPWPVCYGEDVWIAWVPAGTGRGKAPFGLTTSSSRKALRVKRAVSDDVLASTDVARNIAKVWSRGELLSRDSHETLECRAASLGRRGHIVQLALYRPPSLELLWIVHIGWSEARECGTCHHADGFGIERPSTENM